MKRKFSTKDSELAEHSYSARTMEDDHGPSMSQSNRGQTPTNIEHLVKHLLTTRLSPAVLEDYTNKLELLKKCSFYIEILIQGPFQQSTVMQLINSRRFEEMKKLGNSHVKIQLALLEELLDELCKGCEKLQTILKGPALLLLEENAIHAKISGLLQVAKNFEDVSVPSTLHVKQCLISGASSSQVPDIRLRLMLKMPVRFDRNNCAASSDSSAILHWHVIEQEVHEPGEQFEIRYKLLHPSNEAEGSQTATVTCASYCLEVDKLLPGRLYEFTVKRVDSCVLVYSLWIDAVILRTVSATVETSRTKS